jgi:hypothetical protein
MNILDLFDWVSWYNALYEAWALFAERLVSVAPHLIGAGLIIVLGSLLAMGVGEVLAGFLEKLQLDTLLEKTHIHKTLRNAGLKIKVSTLIEEVVRWIILIVIFIAAADVVNLPQVNEFFTQILHYLPNVFIAVIILVVATIVSSFVGNIVTSATNDDLGYYSGLAKGAIYTFAVLAALHQLQISKPLIEILFTGIVAALVLAFGLGGREIAAEILKKFYHDFQAHSKKK